MSGAPALNTIWHASCVALEGQAALIRGAAGSGKSALSLTLLAFGASLISDDRTKLTVQDEQIIAQAAPNLQGLIEARGVGILTATPAPPTPVRVIIDLDKTELERLPMHRHEAVLGIALPVLHKVDSSHFPAAIVQYLKGGVWSAT